MNYGARLYDPQIGRFIQADTVVQDPTNTQAFNRYMYCAGNPVFYTDPTGHEFGDPSDGDGKNSGDGKGPDSTNDGSNIGLCSEEMDSYFDEVGFLAQTEVPTSIETGLDRAITFVDKEGKDITLHSPKITRTRTTEPDEPKGPVDPPAQPVTEETPEPFLGGEVSRNSIPVVSCGGISPPSPSNNTTSYSVDVQTGFEDSRGNFNQTKFSNLGIYSNKSDAQKAALKAALNKCNPNDGYMRASPSQLKALGIKENNDQFVLIKQHGSGSGDFGTMNHNTTTVQLLIISITGIKYE